MTSFSENQACSKGVVKTPELHLTPGKIQEHKGRSNNKIRCIPKETTSSQRRMSLTLDKLFEKLPTAGEYRRK